MFNMLMRLLTSLEILKHACLIIPLQLNMLFIYSILVLWLKGNHLAMHISKDLFFFTVSLHRSTPPGQEYQNNTAIKVYNCCCKLIGTDFKQLVPPLHKVY